MSQPIKQPAASATGASLQTSGASVTSARRYIEYVLATKKGISLPPIPRTCIISYTSDLIETVKQASPHTLVDMGCTSPTPIYFFSPPHGRPFAMARGHHGAPMATVLLEELIALGFSRFLVLGAAGHPANQHVPQLQVGDLVLTDRAMIFEGTSQHYQPGAATVQPDSDLLQTLRRILERRRIPHFEGAVATTDALYRETHEFIDALVRQNVLAVDMEMSAFFTVARHYGKAASGLLFISDLVEAGGTWHLGLLGERYCHLQDTLLDIVTEFVSET